MRPLFDTVRTICVGAARPFAPESRARGALVIAFILVACLVWLLVRAPLAIYPAWFNIDEAQWAASAPNVLDGPIVWRNMDLTTSGPVNALPLLWPYLVGEMPTIMTGRLAAFVLNAASLALIAGALFHATRRLVSIALVAPLYFWSISAEHPDFAHYSSETFSIFLFGLAALLLSFYARSRAAALVFVIGLLFGALPFAKLQSLPIGVFGGAFALALVLRVNRRDRRRLLSHVALLIAGALLPLALLVGPLVFVGELDAFAKGYLSLGVTYRDVVSVGGMKYFAESLPALLPFWIAPVAIAAAGVFAGATVFAAAERRWTPDYFLLFAGGALLLTAILTTVAPGRPFDHYAQYMAWMSPYAAGALALYLLGLPAGRGAAKATGVGVAATAGVCALLVLVFAPDAEDGPLAGRDGWIREFSFPGLFMDRPALLDWTGIEPRRMVVWGWSPAIHVDAQAKPAARISHTQPLFEYAEKAYYRERLLKDVARNGADAIVDAVADGDFRYGPAPQANLESAFPELLAATGLERFENRVAPPRRCPALYLPPAALADLSGRLIGYREIAATGETPERPASRVADRSVFERCADYWLLPDGAAGSVTLSFAEDEVAEVWILNTRNNMLFDRAARDIEVSLTWNGETQWRGAARANPYPQWTVITLAPAVRADALAVSVVSYRGQAGGLNEVMAFRAGSR